MINTTNASNQKIAELFYEIADYLEMDGVPFKPRAYQKAAGVIEGLQEEILEIYRRGGVKAIKKIPGVGVSMAEKIEELLKTGRLRYFEDLKKKMPVNLPELRRVEGLGPKSIKKLYQKLKIKDLGSLEKAAKQGKIRQIKDFGAKTEENILKSIEFVKKSGGRFILGFVMPKIKEIESRLKSLKEVQKIMAAGSVRRRKETVGDVDFLIISQNPKPVMDYFVKMPEVIRIYARGETKSAVKIDNGLNIDIRVVPPESYGAALAYFTGSKDHNIAMREIAIKKGYKLNEYGLYKSQKSKVKSQKLIQVAGRSEEEIYKALGMNYVEPEMRENLGEIELSKTRRLPKLINYGGLIGDLQVQTDWTDGSDSIETMARAAIQQGLKYIAITDHTKRLAMTGGLDEKKIQKQWKEIDRVQKKLGHRIKILKGTECDILKDGSLDLPDEILAKLDVVGASVHSYFNLTRQEQTERLKRAMANPHVDIIFHPTGRIIQQREAYEADMEETIKTAKKTGTILEINAYPDRLDLKDEYIRKCVAAGVKLSIDSDAHSPAHFPYLEYGIAQARRGWAAKNDIVNAWPVEKALKMLKR